MSEYLDLKEKDGHFTQETISTPQEFDRIYDEFKGVRDFLFRGQKEAKWKMYSTLQRKWNWDFSGFHSSDYLRLVLKLVDEGNAIFAGVANGIDNEQPFQTLSFLQHHGCPTPLLDWTFSFCNAVYFALDGIIERQDLHDIDDFFSVYAIEEKEFDTGSMRGLVENFANPQVMNDIVKNLLSGIIDTKQREQFAELLSERNLAEWLKKNGQRAIAHVTRIEDMFNIPICYFTDTGNYSLSFGLNNSANIINQAGVFTWNAHLEDPLEITAQKQYVLARKEGDPLDFRFCHCFNIRKNLSGHIYQKLRQDGITEGFIYPDKNIKASGVYDTVMKNFV